MFRSTTFDACLTNNEKAYFKSLKKKERRKVLRFFETKAVKMNSEPIRLRLIKSDLPEDFKRHLFALLADEMSDKNINLVRTSLRLPFGRYSSIPDSIDTPFKFLLNAENIMDKYITGHKSAKREVLSILAQWWNGSEMPYAIAIEGPPGIGKTTFVKYALAAALNRPFSTICLGGATDGSFLQGHGFTYEGARHGRIAEVLMEMKSMDGIIFFDELDKISDSHRGDEIVNTLIHITDPMQTEFRDRYFQGLDIPLNNCIIIFAYNDARRVHPILLDRLKRIKMDVPDLSAKKDIVKRHLIPRLQQFDEELDEECIEEIILYHKENPGLRQVERTVHDVYASALMCKQYGSQKILGFSEEPLEKINLKFVKKVLENTYAESSNAPPSMMFC